MPWVAPPPDVQRRVAGVLGDAIWGELEASWQKVLLVDPNMRLTQWYRTPQEAIALHRARPEEAALYTTHGLGLSVDVTPTAARRALVIQEATRQGFYVRTGPRPGVLYRGGHLHISAVSDAYWASSPLKAYLRAVVDAATARRD